MRCYHTILCTITPYAYLRICPLYYLNHCLYVLRPQFEYYLGHASITISDQTLNCVTGRTPPTTYHSLPPTSRHSPPTSRHSPPTSQYFRHYDTPFRHYNSSDDTTIPFRRYHDTLPTTRQPTSEVFPRSLPALTLSCCHYPYCPLCSGCPLYYLPLFTSSIYSPCISCSSSAKISHLTHYLNLVSIFLLFIGGTLSHTLAGLWPSLSSHPRHPK
jgi:hypothetical protein